MTDAGIRVVEVAQPAATEGALVTVTSAGICGSDLHALTLGPCDVTWGHEFGGHLDDGTLVAVQPNVTCGRCELCRRGDDHLCRLSRSKYHGWTLEGGFAERVLVDESCLVPVPASVDPGAVALVEPIAVAVHAVNRAPVAPGARALVIGGGTIGLLCAARLRADGVDVAISVRHDRQRDAARALGIDRYDGETGQQFACIIDAAGTSSSIQAAADVVEAGGTVVLVALPWDGLELPMRFVMDEIRLETAIYYGHHRGEREFATAAEFLARHPELPELLITHRFRLQDAEMAFRVAADRQAGAIKVVLLP